MRPGYRSLVRFEGIEIDFGFELRLDDRFEASGISPGASGVGWLSLWASEQLPALQSGHHFELREGTRVIGTGTVLNHEEGQ